MHAGQSVMILVDAYDQNFDGTVEAMPGSTGSVTSLLPPENATGNYVKVVQRLPVRIRFKPGQQGLDRLRPGMSVVPKVWLKYARVLIQECSSCEFPSMFGLIRSARSLQAGICLNPRCPPEGGR